MAQCRDPLDLPLDFGGGEALHRDQGPDHVQHQIELKLVAREVLRHAADQGQSAPEIRQRLRIGRAPVRVGGGEMPLRSGARRLAGLGEVHRHDVRQSRSDGREARLHRRCHKAVKAHPVAPHQLLVGRIPNQQMPERNRLPEVAAATDKHARFEQLGHTPAHVWLRQG